MSKLLFDKTGKRSWDWLAAILLIVLMEVATARLVATLWTLDLNLVLLVTFFGTILGLALGKSLYRRLWVVLLAFLYGSVLIIWQLGLTLDPEIRWNDRLLDMWGRLTIIIQDLFTRRAITDNLLFLLLMSVLFYVLSIYSSFVLVREANPWKVIIPAGVAAFVINSFDALLSVRALYLAVYLLVALFLVARLVFLRNLVKWNNNHTHTPPDIGFELSRLALAFSLVIVLFAWNLPVAVNTFKPVAELWQTTSQPWLSLKDRLSFIFASLSASATSVQNFYTDTLPLGLGSQLSNSVIMEVNAPTTPPNGTRFYWEARTYDTYDKSMWSSSIESPHSLTASSTELNQPGLDVRTVVTFTFYPYQTISNIYTVNEPLWTSLPTQAFMRVNSDGTVNLSALMSKSYLRPGEQYTVRSALDTVTQKQLKNAGTEYPRWVTSEYLQLPDNITPRTRELAKQIATGITDPYDIANAVTLWLRANIQYDQTITQPPARQERIDWFLFDYKKGFCNYYASAEVVLLRSLGIPARLAVGFAEGEREASLTPTLPPGSTASENAQQSTYVVRQNDAHAWPEVFFPGIGWVIFEPTVSQAALTRPSGEDVASYGMIEAGRGRANNLPQELGSERQLPTGGSSDVAAPKSFWTTGNIILFIFLQILLGVTLVLLYQFLRGFRLYHFLERVSIQVPETIEKLLLKLGIPPPAFLVNWIYYLKLPPSSRSYMEINHALDRVGSKPAVNATPSERAGMLKAAIPAAAESTDSLLFEYQTATYSRRSANMELARKAATEIRRLSWRVWIRRYMARFRLTGNRVD